jgi:hypothetical protein
VRAVTPCRLRGACHPAVSCPATLAVAVIRCSALKGSVPLRVLLSARQWTLALKLADGVTLLFDDVRLVATGLPPLCTSPACLPRRYFTVGVLLPDIDSGVGGGDAGVRRSSLPLLPVSCWPSPLPATLLYLWTAWRWRRATLRGQACGCVSPATPLRFSPHTTFCLYTALPALLARFLLLPHARVCWRTCWRRFGGTSAAFPFAALANLGWDGKPEQYGRLFRYCRAPRVNLYLVLPVPLPPVFCAPARRVLPSVLPPSTTDGYYRSNHERAFGLVACSSRTFAWTLRTIFSPKKKKKRFLRLASFLGYGRQTWFSM